MLHSVFWSLLFGFFLAASFLLAMPDTALGAKDGFNSFFDLFNNLPMPFFLKAILAGIVIANYICALAGMTLTSRMIFAFSRDGGLPASKQLATSIRYIAPRSMPSGSPPLSRQAPATMRRSCLRSRPVVRCSSMSRTPYR